MTLPMARYFEEAVGVDPDQDTLAAAEGRARHLGVGNAHWARARAEDLPAGLGTFRVVVFAQSFHGLTATALPRPCSACWRREERSCT